MAGFESEIQRRLDELKEQGLFRVLRQLESPQATRIVVAGAEGRTKSELLNFSSNDYLGLATHPALKEAALKAVERYGTGSGASRLICGSLPPHRDLEQALAGFKQTEAALSFSSGYGTALGTVCALAGKDDVVVLDKLVHASIVDAARLSGATLRVFPHNDVDRLQEILRWADARGKASRGKTLVVTESVFSMDGDHAPLEKIVELKDKYGAWLMLDEAHGTGLYGARGQGLAEELNLASRIEIKMGTLGKALGSAGGFICGARPVIELLINRARSFIYSTAPEPASAAAASAAVDLVQSNEGAARRTALWDNVARLTASLGGAHRHRRSAIIPVRVGPEEEAVSLSTRLQAGGFFVPAIRYPTVARGQARLRVTLSSSHTAAEIDSLAAFLCSKEPYAPTGKA